MSKNTYKNIIIKNDLDIEKLRVSGKRLAQILEKVGQKIAPGIKVKDLDNLAFDLIVNSQDGKKDKDRPAFLNYQPFGARYPFPASLCISVNDEVVHGIPGDYILKEGDIVTLDGGLIHKYMITDHAVTFPVGNISDEKKDLLEITKNALKIGIKNAVFGNYVHDISIAIENFINQEGLKLKRKFGIVKVLSGHGVGYEVHEEPFIPNFDDGLRGVKLLPGMVLAIEPIVSLGSEDIFLAEDGYTYKTEDGSPAAHFEHTILITKNKPEILTSL